MSDECGVPCDVQAIVDGVNGVYAAVDAMGYELCCEGDPDALDCLPGVVAAGAAFIKAAAGTLKTIPTGDDETEWVLVDVEEGCTGG